MHLKEVKSDLAKIYKAPNLEVAEKALEQLEEKRGKIYQTMCNSRRHNWVELSYYFQYPDTLRKLIYTTNIIESNNARIRKVVHK
jgi:transposase-like protein